jgi:hypothetical protein
MIENDGSITMGSRRRWAGSMTEPRWNLELIPRQAGRALVKAYRYTLSPLIGFRCRYLPTCSEYADEALARHGLWAGSWMTAARLCRCHPWGSSGLDFVCEEPPGRARWYLPWRYGRWRGTDPGPGG